MEEGILIVGTGALATYFAAHLSAAGIPVSIFGRWKEGLRALKLYGARVNGFGCFPVKVIELKRNMGKFISALVLVKSWQTEEAAKDLSFCLSDEGLVVTLQNGMGNDGTLSHVLGKVRVGRGVTTMGVILEKPGVVRVGGEGGVILEQNQRISHLEERLRIAKFQVKTVPDLAPHQWGKLVVNSAINPVAALLGVKNGDLVKNRHALSLMSDLALESARVAGAVGVKLPFSQPGKAVIETAQKTSENFSSMLQDIRRGSNTEIDFINGSIVNAGKKVGLTTPCNQIVVKLVKALSRCKELGISTEAG